MTNLTEKQRDLVRLIAKSYKTKEIAAMLGCSPKTIEARRLAVGRKLGFNDPAALTRYAVRTGLITVDE